MWLDPRTLAVHPRNIRDDLGDLSGLAGSIAAQGVLEALTVIPHPAADGTPGHQIVAGHRRAAAAILAGVTALPCVLRSDLALEAASADGDRAAQAGHVGAMLAENLHRQGLSPVEEARGVQAMLDLGVPLTRVAKSTGLARKRVAKAAGVARLDGETAAAVAGAGLTLDQAAVVAVYADDANTTAALIAAAGEGPGQFAHALTRAKQAKQEAEQAAALLAELTAAGRTVLDEDTGRAATRLADLKHDGQPLTTDDHAGCPGSAVYVNTSGWQGPKAVEVCTDPAGNGHRDRWTANALPAGAPGEEPSEDEREAAAAERRATIEKNKAMAAANETRREWIKGLLQRKTAPKAALRFTVETMATDPRALSCWLSGQPNRAQDTAAADLGIDAPGQ
ncbi:ParB N-terminal domain-containing protein [Blastococcus sp. HT6-30]|uniref:ParB/RepB/Spo0J family partition protein n=1 Tax=Blastococcus sp. HT6-30 TaxID=3144843 RepID=UPI00321C1E0A